MNISVFGSFIIKPIVMSLENDGYNIFYNKYSPSTDLLISESHVCMYQVYKYLKSIKRGKVKHINIVYDIPPFRLVNNYEQNSLIKYLLQYSYNYSHKYPFVNGKLQDFINKKKHSKNLGYISNFVNNLVNKKYQNRIFYQMNYRNFLKTTDLNLSISHYTKFCLNKFLKTDSKVWYLGVNSDLLSSLPKPSELKYDAINISRIAKTKRQKLFVDAANKLGLKVIVLGHHQDKSIQLACPHYYLADHNAVLNELNNARFYVDASVFEGFGMTPVEAAFLDKPIIASDTFVHKEILGNYPLYFKKDNINDLVDKMNKILNGEFIVDKEALEIIKKKYSLQESKTQLTKHIESLF